MPTYINDSSTNRELEKIHVNDSGTWRELQKIHVNDSGTWRVVYEQSSSFDSFIINPAILSYWPPDVGVERFIQHESTPYSGFYGQINGVNYTPYQFPDGTYFATICNRDGWGGMFIVYGFKDRDWRPSISIDGDVRSLTSSDDHWQDFSIFGAVTADVTVWQWYTPFDIAAGNGSTVIIA